MKSFKAAFKSVYEKGLMQYGFRKVKGTQPYYVRCIGDEIVHVITFREEFTFHQSHIGVFDKAFVILFGVATVYRGQLMFHEPSKASTEWLSELSTICYKGNYYPVHDRKAYEEMILFRFEYDGTHEEAMMDEIKKSFELTEKYAIPVLDNIKTLEDCIKHFFQYKQSLLRLPEASDAYVWGRVGSPSNEGLLATVIYKDRFEEYENIKLRILEEFNNDELYRINAGICGHTMEQYESNKIERMEDYKEALNIFKELIKPEWQDKIRKELEKRRINNLEILKKYVQN